MMNKLLSIFILINSLLFSSDWFFSENNPWEINSDPRSSALGGVDLYNYSEFNYGQIQSDVVGIFNSRMFNGVIDYNNIYYNKKLESKAILGNTFNNIKFGFFNRSIDNIQNTSLLWNSELGNEPTLSDLNYDLIEYYDHKDIGLSIFLPFSNFIGDFGVEIRSIFSKIDIFKASSLNLDFMWFKKIDDNLSIMTSINNIHSYKKWSNKTSEKFYPALEILTHFKIKKTNCFAELNNIYLNKNFLINQYDVLDNVKLGIEHKVNDMLLLRLGYSESYQTYGFGLFVKSFMFNYSYLKHANLDFSNQFSIAYLIDNR